MTMQRSCYFCGHPVSIRRRMSLFCSPRCETLHAALHFSHPATSEHTPPPPRDGPPSPGVGPRPPRPRGPRSR